jgi:hypothetical protein
MLKSEDLKKEWERLHNECDAAFVSVSAANEEVTLADATLHYAKSVHLRLLVSHSAIGRSTMDARNRYFDALHEEQEAERNAVAVPGGVVTLSEH